MRTVAVSEAKDQLSALLRAVQAGERVLIVNRGRPVARLEPVGGREGVDDERLDRLERAGIIRRAALPPSPTIIDGPLPALPEGAGLVAAVLEEREGGW